MVFDNYALVLSDSQMDLLASKLGIVNPDTEALAVHFKSTFPGRFQSFIGELMREPVWLDEALRTTPCVWNMLLSRRYSTVQDITHKTVMFAQVGFLIRGMARSTLILQQSGSRIYVASIYLSPALSSPSLYE